MEDAKRLGELALKLEKYRYNLMASVSWVIFGMVFGSAVTLLNALFLFGLKWHGVLIATLIPAGFVSGIIYYKMAKLIAPKTDDRWKHAWVFYALPFIVAYAVIPCFVNLTPLQQALYYSTVWYPSLGIAFTSLGIYVERKDDLLVTKTLLPAGITILLSTAIIVVLGGYVKSYTDVLAVGLIATSMMLIVYLTCAVYSFFKSYRVLL
jgi:hypothetical protein